MFRRLAIGAIAISLVTLFPLAAAQAQQQRGMKLEDRFKAADKDNDGSLDKEEAKAMPRVAQNFDAIDADKDGTVTEKEIHDYMRTHGSGGKMKGGSMKDGQMGGGMKQ